MSTEETKVDIRSSSYAQELDAKYPSQRDEFFIPTLGSLGYKNCDPNDSRSSTYLCGNSLGLMPKSIEKAVTTELEAWKGKGIVGHHRRDKGEIPWTDFDIEVDPLLVPILGAEDASEVSIQNTLTINLHTMFLAFYKPTAQRYKILYEKKAFPSDIYGLHSQAKLHGFDPKDALIPLAPREGEYTLRTEDILAKIQEEKDSIAIVFFAGVQFYTGQWFEMEKITKAGHEIGAVVGWDLAHCSGNVPLKLHDWGVDFAILCTYKYLNSGPGNIGAIFVHKKHANDNRFRLAGWWGNNAETRFQMLDDFEPIPGAAGFKVSNPSALSLACLKASLEIYQKAGGMEVLRERSLSLTNYLYALLTSSKFYIPVEESFQPKRSGFTIITPSNPQERGSQLSLLFLPMGKGVMQHVFDLLEEEGVIGDKRQPDVIRLAPSALYNTHADCLKALQCLEMALESYNRA